jgi:hypothetical protein
MNNLERELESAIGKVYVLKWQLESRCVVQKEISHKIPWISYEYEVEKENTNYTEPEEIPQMSDVRPFFHGRKISTTTVTRTSWEGSPENDPAIAHKNLPWYKRIFHRLPKGKRREYIKKVIDLPEITEPDLEKRQEARFRLGELILNSPWFSVRSLAYEVVNGGKFQDNEYRNLLDSWMAELLKGIENGTIKEKSIVDLAKLRDKIPWVRNYACQSSLFRISKEHWFPKR